MSIIKSSWYVAQLKPNGFNKARLNLVRQGFECFMPMRKITVRHARKLSTCLRPVFPGYIFVKFELDKGDWRKINSTPGVNKLISFHERRPSKIPDPLLEVLISRCDEHQTLIPISDWKTGDKACMVSGPFTNFIGQVETFVSSERVRLLFEFMGQFKTIEASSSDLERC